MNTTYPLLETHTKLGLSRGCLAFAVMAKTPSTGTVKTRLVPPLEPEEAALLNRCFLQDVTDCIATLPSDTIHPFVAYTPLGHETAFDGLLPAGFRLLPQRGANLGERLFHAIEDFLAAGYEGVCLINSDSPTLPGALLRMAMEALSRAGDRLVLGKAVDGGYYLIGAKKAHLRLFQEITWSSALVFEQTMERARELALEVEVLPPWYDVDDAESLLRLHEELFSKDGQPQPGQLAPNPAPHTRRYLRSLFEKKGHALGIGSAAAGTT